jgi:kumamolisin
MPNPDHVAMLRSGIDTWREWRNQNPDIIPDIEGAELRQADLRGADLSDVRLRGADLRGVQFGNSNLVGTDLRECTLRDADLSLVSGVRSQQFAGADLAGARLPDSLRNIFDDLDVAKAISENAQKLFIAMLAACLYSWLTIATTTDVGLITNRASTPLPVIQTSIPIVGFYIVTPLLLVGLYFYFHFYLQKLWDEMSSLPAIFPDGRPLQMKADPWLLSDLVRSHVSRLRADRPFLSHLQAWISILLAWWVVPITLTLFWVRYLPRHDKVGTVFHCVLIAICVTGAIFLYRLASATMRGEPRKPFVWKLAQKRLRAWQPLAAVVVVCAIFAIISMGAIGGVRSGTLGRDWWPPARGLLAWIPATMEKIGYSPFADLRAADISVKPLTWTGKTDAELNTVKGSQLSGIDLRYADMRGAFLAGALLTGAHLEFADLLLADLRQAELAGAHLQGADLLGARLNGADLSDADLRNADLNGADLTDAELKHANLREASGLSPGDLAKAKHWQDAFYNSDILQALKLPELNNTRLQKEYEGENAAIRGNEPLGRVGQVVRSIPGMNMEVTTLMTWLITHKGGLSEVTAVPVPNKGPAGTGKSFFTVTELARIYNFPNAGSPEGLDGRGQTIGIIEFAGGYRNSDIDAYFSHSKIPKPDILSVSVNGKKNSPDPPGAFGSNSQVEMDIEVAGSVAPGARLVIYFSDGTAEGWVEAITTATHDMAHRPSVLLIGWGSPEGQLGWGKATIQKVNEALHEAAMAGITVVVAAGDDRLPNFPASSPWVLAVGGTMLHAAGNSSVSEVDWNVDPGKGATGGGVSDYFPQPDWQHGVSVPKTARGKSGRGLPDVAANADPQTGYQLQVDGRELVIGGTGAATALWAGLIALLNQGLGRNVGYLNPVLYEHIGPAGVLRAMTKGDKSCGGVKGYSASPGWNYCTGWGTPDGRKLLEALRSIK